MVDYFECGDELPFPEFLDYLKNCWLPKENPSFLDLCVLNVDEGLSKAV